VIDGNEVKAFILKELTACAKTLENCPHDEIDLVRGRMQAYRRILRLEEQEVQPFMAAPGSFPQ
jgi:hypothetical protein